MSTLPFSNGFLLGAGMVSIVNGDFGLGIVLALIAFATWILA